MGIRGKRREKRSRAEWAELFERFEASGLSGAAFCQREGISKSSFARWKRLLSAGPATGEFVEWTPAAPTSPSPATPALASGELELSFPGGVRLRFRP
jgi:hypothetical protein